MRKTTGKALLVVLFLASMLSMAFNVAPVAAQYEVDGYTVGLWHFDEGMGDTIYDETGYHNDGIIYGGAAWTAGMFDGALSFDGVDDWVEIPDSDSLDLTYTFTLELWVKPAIDIVPGLPYYTVLTKWTGVTWPWFRTGYMLQFKHGGLFFYIGFGYVEGVYVYNAFRTAKNIWDAGEWYHIAVTYDRGNVIFYVNGVFDSQYYTYPYHEVQPPESIAVNDLFLCINAHHDLPHPRVTFFPGVIDEVHISNIARSPETIASHATDGFLTLLKTDISELPDGVFDKPPEDIADIRDDLVDKLGDIEENIEESNYERAIEHLVEIKEFVDEQIVDSAEKEEVIGMIDALIAYLEML